MGIYNSTNIPQENIFEIFQGFGMLRAYIDDVLLMTNNDFKEHLKSYKDSQKQY